MRILVLAIVGVVVLSSQSPAANGNAQSTPCRAISRAERIPADDSVPRCAADVTLPKPTKERRPRYTTNAMRQRAQGSVEMDVVVTHEGKVRDPKVVKALHPELDESAMRAVRDWEFEPAKRDGKPVAVVVRIEMTFTLRSSR